jgi:hypothetical protein
MGDSMKGILERFSFLEALKPFVTDDDAISRIRVDLNDLLEAGKWLSDEIALRSKNGFNDWRDIEKFLIDLDIQYLTHARFHMDSLRSELTSALNNFPDDEEA